MRPAPAVLHTLSTCVSIPTARTQCAVLTPCGPLKWLVSLAQTRQDPIPGLLYEANVGPVQDESGREAVRDTFASGAHPAPLPSARSAPSAPAGAVIQRLDGMPVSRDAGSVRGNSGVGKESGAPVRLASSTSVTTDAAVATTSRQQPVAFSNATPEGRTAAGRAAVTPLAAAAATHSDDLDDDGVPADVLAAIAAEDEELAAATTANATEHRRAVEAGGEGYLEEERSIKLGLGVRSQQSRPSTRGALTLCRTTLVDGCSARHAAQIA